MTLRILNTASRYSLFALSTSFCVLQAPLTYAIDYGTYDARALAMGGTAVAVGDTSQAAYYNPALLAFHEGDEDKTRDGRTYFPTLVVRAADTVNSALKAVDDNLDSTLSNAINTYNINSSSSNAALVAQGSRDLREVLDEIANKDLTFDAFLGLSVSEPSDHAGGAFYFGVRTIAAGTSQVTKTDLALLEEYISATEKLASGALPATVAEQHPNLINANGQLRNLTNTLNSSADVSALAISEWGLALAKEFSFWGQAISFGITPKMMRVDAYRDNANFSTSDGAVTLNDQLNQFSDTKSTHMAFNADFGVASIIADHYRISFTIKDSVAKDFSTTQSVDPITGLAKPDLEVKLHPRSRVGLAYVKDSFSIGVDYDLKESTPIAKEAASQNLSLGAEYRLFDGLALRAGFRQDQTGLRDDLISAGMGYRWRRFLVEIAYAESNDMKGGGLQFGWTF